MSQRCSLLAAQVAASLLRLEQVTCKASVEAMPIAGVGNGLGEGVALCPMPKATPKVEFFLSKRCCFAITRTMAPS